MDKKEFAAFAAALKTYFPKENLLPNPQAMELWFRQLEDIPYQVAELSLNKWVATNKWSPSIADIREMAAEVTSGRQSDWGEGWEKTIKAIRKYGYTNPEGALASLDETTRKTVERLGWMELCISENAMADRANFRIIYEQEQVRAKENAALPAGLKTQIAGLQGAAIKALGEAGKGSGGK